jgi:hypothetical protein
MRQLNYLNKDEEVRLQSDDENCVHVACTLYEGLELYSASSIQIVVAPLSDEVTVQLIYFMCGTSLTPCSI